MKDEILTDIKVHFDNEIDDIHIKMLKGEKGDKGDKGEKGDPGAVISATEPTLQNTVVWVDTSEEASVFNEDNFYTKAEVDKKISDAISSLEDGDGRSY